MNLSKAWKDFWAPPLPPDTTLVLEQIRADVGVAVATYHNCPAYACDACRELSRDYFQYPNGRVICKECNGNL